MFCSSELYECGSMLAGFRVVWWSGQRDVVVWMWVMEIDVSNMRVDTMLTGSRTGLWRHASPIMSRHARTHNVLAGWRRRFLSSIQITVSRCHDCQVAWNLAGMFSHLSSTVLQNIKKLDSSFGRCGRLNLSRFFWDSV